MLGGNLCRVAGTYEYVTAPVDVEHLTSVVGADDYAWTQSGRLRISVSLEADDARIVFIL